MFTGFLILVVAAMTFSIVAFAWKLRVFTRLPRPVDRALPKGSIASGVLYAYTLGIAPWSKESTRRHCVMLENCCYDYWETLVKRMVFAGLLQGNIEGETATSADVVWPGGSRVRLEARDDAPPTGAVCTGSGD